MATAYKIVHEEEKKAKLCSSENKKISPELAYPEPKNILSTEVPVPQPTCE